MGLGLGAGCGAAGKLREELTSELWNRYCDRKKLDDHDNYEDLEFEESRSRSLALKRAVENRKRKDTT